MQAASGDSVKPRARFVGWPLLVALLLGTMIFTVRWLHEPARPIAMRLPTRDLTFVGAPVCASCHQHENELWRGSHHQLAMQRARDSTVLGDFNHVTFDNNGVKSSFFRDGSKYMVRTDGPDGALHDYEVGYTFGVYPLQQYLIAMPGGRLQAFGIAWDTRPRESGARWMTPPASAGTRNRQRLPKRRL